MGICIQEAFRRLNGVVAAIFKITEVVGCRNNEDVVMVAEIKMSLKIKLVTIN